MVNVMLEQGVMLDTFGHSCFDRWCEWAISHIDLRPPQLCLPSTAQAACHHVARLNSSMPVVYCMGRVNCACHMSIACSWPREPILVDTLYRVQSRVIELNCRLEPWSRLRKTFYRALYGQRSHDIERLAAVRSSGPEPPSGRSQMPWCIT